MGEQERVLRAVPEPERGFVDFWPAGTVANGRFRCTACGNTRDVTFVLPRCYTCGEGLWERDDSRYAGGVVMR